MYYLFIDWSDVSGLRSEPKYEQSVNHSYMLGGFKINIHVLLILGTKKLLMKILYYITVS
jgi:hypothetical protein